MKTQIETPFFVDAENSPVSLFSEIKNVLPLSVQNKLIHLRDEHDRLQWVVGDLYNEIYAHVRANGVQATRADVANYLLYSLGLEDERGFSSVLVDAATAGFYPSEIREKYSVLTFSHFRFAASFGENACSVLDEAMTFFDTYSRPPSVRWLKKQYQFFTNEQAAAASDPGSSLTPGASAAISGTFGRGPDWYKSGPVQPIDRVQYYVQGLKGVVPGLSGVRGDLIAKIIALCEQALETL